MKTTVLISLIGLILLLSGFIVFLFYRRDLGAVLSFAGVIVYLIQKSIASKI